MGLLDWLSDSLGGLASSAGANPIGLNEPMTSAMLPPGAPPIPTQGMATPSQMFDSAPAMPPNATTDPAALPPQAAPLFQTDTVHLNATPTSAPPLPPPIDVGPPTRINATMTQGFEPGGGGFIPAMPPPIIEGGARPGPNGGAGEPTSFLGRALGLDENSDRSLRGSLGAGFKAAGNSAGKSPFQAFSSGLGEGMEGGVKTEQKGYDQRLRALQLAVRAQAIGDMATYRDNMAKYAGEKLHLETEKMARGGGKGSAWNKPDSQRFIDAQNATSKDRHVIDAENKVKAARATGSPEEISAAQANFEKVYSETERKMLQGVQLDPASYMDMQKNPPGSKLHPHVVTSQADFDTYVKPGQFYKNPADGKVYIRKGAEPATNSGGNGDSPAIPAIPTDPSLPPIPDDPSLRPLPISDDTDNLDE